MATKTNLQINNNKKKMKTAFPIQFEKIRNANTVLVNLNDLYTYTFIEKVFF